jgi:hypothetical protein
MRVTLTAFFILFVSYSSFAQVPGVKWTNYYVSNDPANLAETFFDAKHMPDGGFILAGCDTAYGYDKEAFFKKDVIARPFLVRADKDGNKLWHLISTDVNYYFSSFTSVDVDATGDIIVAGYGIPVGINASTPVKYLVTKYNSNGTKIWSNKYGGMTGNCKAYSIQHTSDNGYIVAGVTNTNDGDVSGNHHPGTTDVWMLKLDNSGNIQWKKCFGGSGDDSAYAVIQTPDNGFIVAGCSTSSDGDLTGNNGASDAWIFKVDNLGNLVWQKNIGGSNYDDFRAIVYNSDTTFTITGCTSSSTITNNGNYGMRDLWLIKIKDDTGDIQWSKNFGGSNNEQGFSIQRTVGNGYLVAGYTESTSGDIAGNNGLADAWLLKLDANGILLWQKCVGTNKNDFGTAGIYMSETDFAIAGFSEPFTPKYEYDFTDPFLSRLGNANTIKALLFNDVNINGVKDMGEGIFNEAKVTTTQSGFERSAIPQNGIVNIDVGLGTYSTSVHINSPYFNISPTSTNSTFATYFNTDSISFAVQPIPNKRDLVISAIPSWNARPGTFQYITIFYKNIGTDIVNNGEILFKHDSRLVFGNSSPAITSSNGDTLKWSFTNLKPFDSASIRLAVDLPLSLHLGDTLTSIAIITPVANDVTPFDDTAIIKQRVVGSYDPNDKTENNGGIIGSDYIAEGKYLNYTIRFQNTGTDTAFNVIVRDTLDNKLDWSTFEMVTASHPYTVSITNQNKIEWTFSNINLPDSNINEPLSHGYLSYRVKPKSTAVVGDVINNLASIYFDYNLPVATNNALTLVQDNFSALPIQLLNFTGQLNNNTVQLQWKIGDAKNFERFEIERSLDGRNYSGIQTVAFTNSITNYHSQDYVSTLQSRQIFYRLKLVDADGKFSYSKVIVFNLNTTQSNFIVYPNPVTTELFVSLSAGKKQNLTIKILDASGRTILNQQKEIQNGNNVFPVNTSKLKGGSYLLQIIFDGESKASRFTIIN